MSYRTSNVRHAKWHRIDTAEHRTTLLTYIIFNVSMRQLITDMYRGRASIFMVIFDH